MSTELSLRFPDPGQVIVSCGGEESGVGAFVDPLTAADRQDLRWYLEVYGAHSLGDPDDGEAARIAGRLATWGQALFEAVFSERAAQRVFNAFQDTRGGARLLTVSTEHPAVPGLPWELLHDSGKGGIFLFNERPRISIRRRVAGGSGGRAPFTVRSKDRLHLLFVVSRPEGSGFLDPRADVAAVLDALEGHAPGRVTWEVLRPPTLAALGARLDDRSEPAVDILHFDGHGVFDTQGGLPERLARRTVSLQEALAGTMVKEQLAVGAGASPPNTGYLLFEAADGGPDLVGADKLGLALHRREVPLVILSACQSAAQGGVEPLSSVAARLTAAGIPAVLAMAYSVLVPTTRALFGELYKQLAQHRGVGEALDAARLQLLLHPEKYEVQRGPKRVPLRLFDWFVPALYQAGADVPLLEGAKKSRRAEKEAAAAGAVLTNIPARPETGFFGRKRELWEIERWLAGRTRRITLTGFGGQGKTALAQEAGRWLTRTGLFGAAVFVDYSRGQAADAVAVAVSQIGSVLGQSLPDARAAEAALREKPTLLVLDNLEALRPEALRELLDAAVGWSEAGASRVLLTTRTPDFGHPGYRIEGTHVHRRIVLDGLGRREAPDDALEWFAELSKLPPAPEVAAPAREAVVELFDKVRFHPLSILVLAQQLKTRRPAELGGRLEELLKANAGGSAAGAPEAMVPELVASLQLSLDRLDASAREVLPRLGVFQGGAFEDDLLAITGLGEDTPARPRTVPVMRRVLERVLGPAVSGKARSGRAAGSVWPELRRQLEFASLLQAEAVPGVGPPFLRFHPTLAPMLWVQVSAEERAQLTAAHRERYRAVAHYLYGEDTRHPHQARAIAVRELPNLLQAVQAAFAAQDPDAVNFADSVTMFLTMFGLKREAEELAAQAQAASGEAGSRAWFLAQSNRGEQLLESGQIDEAIDVSRAILDQLGDAPTHARAVTLGRLGRCWAACARLDLAEQRIREGLAVTRALKPTDDVKQLMSTLHTEIGDVLAQFGRYAEARTAYETGLTLSKELGDVRSQGVKMGQLGALALLEGNLRDALERYQAALAFFQELREPAMESVAWHQLGIVFHEAGQWDEAERHYREAARLREANGLITGPNGAVTTWNQLARVSMATGKPEAAEQWYRKALEVYRDIEDPVGLAVVLNNLANLLGTQSSCLPEARQLAEEALRIKKTLDPAAAEIWKIYLVLADIADKEIALNPSIQRQAELRAQAREYRRLAREAKRSFPGTRHELKRHLAIIVATLRAVEEPAPHAEFEAGLADGEQRGWTNLVAALRRILANERDADRLCEGLDLEDSMIIEAILAALSDPSSLRDLLPSEPSPS